MGNAKRYLLVLLLTNLGVLAIIAIVNFIIDPYWQYGFSRTKPVNGLNHQPAPSVLELDYPDLLLEQQMQLLARESAELVIIGSSRSLIGYNTCKDERILKVGAYGLANKQALVLFEKVLSINDYKVVYVEVGALFNKEEFNTKDLNMLFSDSGLLSTNMLLKSLQTISTSWSKRDQSVPQCSVSFPNRPHFATVEGMDIFDSSYTKLTSAEIKSQTEQVLSKLASLCGRAGRKESLHVSIIFAPVWHELVEIHQLREWKKAFNQYLAAQYNTKGCIVRWDEFEDTKVQQDANLWFDQNHFMPVVGNIFLNTLVSRDLDRDESN